MSELVSRKELLEFQAELAGYGIECRVYERDSPYRYLYFDGEEHRCETDGDVMELMIQLSKRLKDCSTHTELLAEMQKQYMELGYDSETAAAAALADMNDKHRGVVEK